MKIKTNDLDTVVYIIACILTFGAVWVTRITISMAMRKAIQE